MVGGWVYIYVWMHGVCVCVVVVVVVVVNSVAPGIIYTPSGFENYGEAGIMIYYICVCVCMCLCVVWVRHFVTQGVLPSVVVLGCVFFLPVCGFVKTFD